MRGDFSRIRFNPAKNYTAVLDQQGRPSLDSDGNEGAFIEGWLRDTTNVDVIGAYGGPIGDAGFEISIAGAGINIATGRYYVEGLLVENDARLSYDDQPYLINPSYSALQLLSAVANGSGQVTGELTLQVWERLVTALDDCCLREPALGQADTTARLQTVWRVIGQVTGGSNESENSTPSAPTDNTITGEDLEKVRPIAQASAVSAPADTSTGNYVDPTSQLSSCCQALYRETLVSRTGSMSADTGTGNTECGCSPVPSAGYQGLENQLYRVEIHSPGTLDTATLKWSRENGSVVAAVTQLSGAVVTASSLGPDVNLGFQPGQWVELSDDTYLFGETPNQAGQLYQISSLGPGALQVTLSSPVTGIDTRQNARMRRWDQSGSGATAQGIALSSKPIALENGIEVTFRKGSYQPGDYWTIVARTASGTIDWPPCGSDGNLFQPAKYTPIYNAPLACISWKRGDKYQSSFHADGEFITSDCRLLFPPLTALAQDQTADALHVASVSWQNDDIMTVDALLQNGLFLTLDQAATSPWSGANFAVSLECPLAGDNVPRSPAFGGIGAQGGTDVFVRTVVALDPPSGITVSGTKVTWLAPASLQGPALYNAYYLYEVLNTLLGASNPAGYARVRIRLLGDTIYAAGANGNLYLDGGAFGDDATRAGDGSTCIGLDMPSGTGAKASDFQGWFYLASSVLVTTVAIELFDNTTPVSGNAVTVNVTYQGIMSGLQAGTGTAATTVTAINAVIGLSYAPSSATSLSLQLTSSTGSTIATIASTAQVAAGKTSVTVPIQIVNSPGAGTTVTFTLVVSVSGALGNRPASQQPTLAVTGGAVPAPPLK
ncbi:MAG TPA: DUF6519 domain-containing protein [Acidobacteriaceae bacterium]|nr:DUF6519 domain-containing protein [Acidobacteriaceae bacterium]